MFYCNRLTSYARWSPLPNTCSGKSDAPDVSHCDLILFKLMMKKKTTKFCTHACTHTLTLTNTRCIYDGGVRGGSPSSLGVAVSSLGSRLSFRLTVLSEGGGVDSEHGEVNSAGGGVSREGPSWVPLVVAGGAGSCAGMAAAQEAGVKRSSACDGAELERRLSVRDSEVFSTKRHCMMLMSFPPVEIRWLSLYRKLTLVTWLLWALYLWLGACKQTQMHADLCRLTRQSKIEVCVCVCLTLALEHG